MVRSTSSGAEVVGRWWSVVQAADDLDWTGLDWTWSVDWKVAWCLVLSAWVDGGFLWWVG